VQQSTECTETVSKTAEEPQTARIAEMRGRPEERGWNLLTVGRLLLLLLLLLSLSSSSSLYAIAFMQGIYSSMGYAVARLVESEG